MLQVGIVGLANVGKSTLFNALLKKQQALVANYPFATIEPNVGIVAVPDARLEMLREVTEREEGVGGIPIVPAVVKFVDIAGLVKGASEGAGLGNKFLAHIREVDLILEVIRDFADESVVREGSSIDPESDRLTVETELILADLQTLNNQRTKLKNLSSSSAAQRALEKLIAGLNKGLLAGEVVLDDEEREAAKEWQLLTAKPILRVYNVSYEEKKQVTGNTDKIIRIDAKVENELAGFSPEEQKDLLASYGLEEPGLNRIIRQSYWMLDLISFFTAGEKEVRAWTIRQGTKAPAAAGVIHSDFQKNFIKAEVVSYEDFVASGGWKRSRQDGKVRLEGKDYVVQEADIVEFKVGC